MKRVLIVHPRLRPHGGGQAVAAWVLQALRDYCRLSLLTCEDVDYEGVNRTFGTSLRPGDFAIHRPAALFRLLLKTIPGRGDILAISAMMRRLNVLDRACRFDVILSTHNEMDFGRRGVQYVHYPYAYERPPSGSRKWYHRPWAAISVYRLFCQVVSPITMDGLRCNVTLANSGYIAERVLDVHGIRAMVVHPPVPGGFPDVPWDEREDGVVCLGRFAPVKQLTDAVSIVDGLRARGHALRLHLVGTSEDPGYEAILRTLAQTREWMQLHVNLRREEMTALVARQRYGLHPQVGEHFGIAPAELVRAGCVTFVARPGGPVEIVGNEPCLIFSSPPEAVDVIDQALRDEALLRRLRLHLRARQDLFTEERFMGEIRQAVDTFDGHIPPTGDR